MTLWINGDWVTGEGEQRVKPIQLEKRCCGREMTPASRRSSRPAVPHDTRFPRGQNGHSPSAGAY